LNKIHVGFLVAYDYELLYKSIPIVYEEADAIFLAIDKDRRTWNGNSFSIQPEFFRWVTNFDKDGKIHLYEENFYVPELTTMQCEVRERKMLSEHMGIGNWLLQLDADEYFIDFSEFVNFLRSKNHLLKNPERHPVEVDSFLINIFKRVNGGLLIVDKATKIRVATNWPDYKVGRKTKNRVIYHNSLILHECLSRTREELEIKFDNWGHNVDVDKKAYLDRWESIDETNYKESEGHFYLSNTGWKHLDFIKGNTIEEWSSEVRERKNMYKSDAWIFKKNLGQRIKHLFK
jgi:hypothetical protein